MIDCAFAFARGGLVLWKLSLALTLQTAQVDAANKLVANVLIEERAALSAAFAVGNISLRWTLANSHGIVFVVAHHKSIQVPYMNDLLETLKSTFVNHFKSQLSQNHLVSHLHEFAQFDPVFNIILETLHERSLASNKPKVPRTFKESKKYANTLAASQEQSKPKSSQPSADVPQPPSVADTVAAKLDRLTKRGVGPRKSTKPKEQQPSASESKKGKERRTWDADGTPISSGSAPDQLDFSHDAPSDPSAAPSANLIGSGLGRRSADGTYDALEMDDSFDHDKNESDQSDSAQPTKPGIFSFFEKWTSGRVLSEADLDAPMLKMKEHLVNKNVAADIAAHLCKSVTAGLVGQRIGAFQSLNAAIRDQIESALKRILTPSTSIDLLRDIQSRNREGKPYSIVFVGVNGVGKSTNLSKLCFWLLQNRKRVLIAACDTFRSGAVEQLRVHARNLKALCSGDTTAVVDLFDRGYGKDPAGIAKDAIAFAASNQYDVVLIDTAGRMQDNEPLMRALSKLVSVNQPDKILFIGEALVGNESVDQLTKFNQSLRDFSGHQSPRQIDGIILTKFDTIDDKVGAALSMTYTTGKPVLFVGTGQTYTDLRKMNVKSIVNLLIK